MSDKARRIEVDSQIQQPTLLAFSAMMMAGLDGIKNQIDPVPMDKDLFAISREEEALLPTVAPVLMWH